MPVDDAIRAKMPHLFGWKQKNGQDAWQSPTYAEPVQLRGIHHDGEHEVEDDNGVKQIAMGVAYLDDVYPIDSTDRLEFCGRELGKIIKIETWPDPRTGGPYGMAVHHG